MSTTDTSGSTVDVSDKYVGVWAACFYEGANSSERDVFTITKVSATQLTFSFVVESYGTGDCTGAMTPEETGSGRIAIAPDTVVVSGSPPQTAEKLDIVVETDTGATAFPPGTTLKWIARATSTQLFVGRGTSTTYPSTFSTTYTKQ